MVMTQVKNGSPDMILTAFEGKCDLTKDEIPLEVCRPQNKLKKNNVEKVNLQKVKNKKTMSIKRVYIHIYIDIYIYILGFCT